jgi:predicted nucleic acid-binding protein
MRRVFIDTNILVYAVDKDAGAKRSRAMTALRPFFKTQARPILSLQVIHEFTYRLFRWGIEPKRIEAMVSPMYRWRVIANDVDVFREGMNLKERFQLSFWDSLILSSAIKAQADELWSEDFNTGQRYNGILAVNPLLPN